MPSDTLDTISFSQAKSQLSTVMDKVVHRGEMKIVDRHHGKEEMALLDVGVLQALLSSFEFRPVASVSDGEFVLELPELGLIAGADSFDAAVSELVDLTRAYSAQYLARRAFYAEAGLDRHFPWALKAALTDDATLRTLLVSPPADPAPALAPA
jgi:hypothetical protein